MKVILVLSIMFLGLTPIRAVAGVFIKQNILSTSSFVQGEGKTPDEARADAFSAIPSSTKKGVWQVAKDPSPEISCKESRIIEGEYCEEKNDLFVMVFPVVFKKYD